MGKLFLEEGQAGIRFSLIDQGITIPSDPLSYCYDTKSTLHPVRAIRKF